MRFAVLQTKGGVGKTTVSMQVLPFVNEKKWNIYYAESINRENIIYQNSKKLNIINLESTEDIQDSISDMLTADNYIFDLGASMIESALHTITEIVRSVDIVFIPTTASKSDIAGIPVILEYLKFAGSDAKVVIVLNRMRLTITTLLAGRYTKELEKQFSSYFDKYGNKLDYLVVPETDLFHKSIDKIRMPALETLQYDINSIREISTDTKFIEDFLRIKSQAKDLKKYLDILFYESFKDLER